MTLLLNWLPIIISALSLIANVILDKKNNKQNVKYRKRILKFQIQREKTRRQERKIDEIFMHLNCRSNLIPYFHLVLDDSKIKYINNDYSKKIILEIGLINIGKESATRVMLYPLKEDPKIFLKVLYEQESSYVIYDYFNQNFASPKECITFSIIKELPKECDERIANFIKFKIRFQDLLGNLYEQEFEFIYDNFILNGFNSNNSSGIPHLIEESRDYKEESL